MSQENYNSSNSKEKKSVFLQYLLFFSSSFRISNLSGKDKDYLLCPKKSGFHSLLEKKYYFITKTKF